MQSSQLSSTHHLSSVEPITITKEGELEESNLFSFSGNETIIQGNMRQTVQINTASIPTDSNDQQNMLRGGNNNTSSNQMAAAPGYPGYDDDDDDDDGSQAGFGWGADIPPQRNRAEPRRNDNNRERRQGGNGNG